MAEEQPKAEHEVEHGGEHAGEHDGGHAEGHGESKGPPDAMSHIADKVMFGLSADGNVVWKPYGDHGGSHVLVAGYAPQQLGPVKLEFTKHMLDVTVVAGVFFALAMAVSQRVVAGLRMNKAPKGALANAFEAVVVFIRDEIVVPVGGHHLGHYTPLFITYFLFILIANLIGMIPEAGTATGNFFVTFGLALSVYLLIWTLGMYNQGPIKYIMHLVPPGTPLLLWPLLFVLEITGPIIKCFVLSVRLFANMIAGHLIIGTILGLTTLAGGMGWLMIGVGVPLAFGIGLLEILVCFLQAYVFTMLAVVFIGAAVHPEH